MCSRVNKHGWYQHCRCIDRRNAAGVCPTTVSRLRYCSGALEPLLSRDLLCAIVAGLLERPEKSFLCWQAFDVSLFYLSLFNVTWFGWFYYGVVMILYKPC